MAKSADRLTCPHCRKEFDARLLGRGPPRGLQVPSLQAVHPARAGRAPRRARSRLDAVLETLRLGKRLEALQRRVLDLPDALARDAEGATDLLEREGLRAEQAVAELDHLPLPLGEGVERALDVFPAERQGGGVERRLGAVVLDEVTELALLLLADRLLERDRELRHAEDLPHLLCRHLQLLRDLLR